MTTPFSYDPLTWGGVGDFTVTTALSPDDKAAVGGWLEAEHFLGEFKPGHSLIQIIREEGNPVAGPETGVPDGDARCVGNSDALGGDGEAELQDGWAVLPHGWRLRKIF